jgi:minichromosome maintenance protein 10
VPVVGDWVTIAVVAERGPIRHTRAPVDITQGDDGRASDGGTGGSKSGYKGARNKSDKNGPKGQAKPHGKKYVSMKLIDFGARSRSSASGEKSAIRGDAFLTLLLFESDGFDKVTGENGSVKKIYQGGSKGAFEAMSKLKEGDVVALLNPKILKPLQVREFYSLVKIHNVFGPYPSSAQ